MRTRIKFCGMTRPEDIDAAVQAGADAVGFIFYPKSKRYIDPAQAARLRRAVPAFVSVVSLFVNAPDDVVRRVMDEVQPDLLQFHGDESAEHCASYGHRWIRAFRVGGPGADTSAALASTARNYHQAAGWLFDSHTAGYGGSGLAFEHQLLDTVRQDEQAAPLILSGGLDPQNVGVAIRTLRPWAVDVCSGVEDEPGIKSPDKIWTFADAVQDADADANEQA
jgi:phosphoribosylanthranilate isomerase